MSDLLMYVFVAPALGVLLLLAFWSGDVVLILGAVVFSALMFGLYLLTTWGD